MLDLTQIAVDAALKAGEILLSGFGASFQIRNKEGKNNLVTEYDIKSEEAIITLIKSKYPKHRFLAEESGGDASSAQGEIRWVIDPLDGTVNFAHSLPIFSVSIAAELDGEILCGVINNPILSQLFIAEKGTGSYLNGEPIKVSTNPRLDSSFLVTGFPYNVGQDPCGCIEHFTSIIRRGIPVRRLGSAALDLAYTAAGIFDGFWEVELNPWDVAAGALLVEEAGGKITQYDKSPYNIFAKSILATNGLIHDEVAGALMSCNCVKVD